MEVGKCDPNDLITSIKAKQLKYVADSDSDEDGPLGEDGDLIVFS